MSQSADQKREMTRRRRKILADKPDHYCPECTVLVYTEDESCLECPQARPEAGWPHVRDSLDPWLGRSIENRYLVTKRIGQGASASVYRAESLAISRQFAIKLINPPKGSSGPTAEQIAGRLEREVEAIGRLRNPHVVHFYDVIELPLNHIGVVMDFVEGQTLEREVELHGAMSIKRATSLLRQIANGIYEAHLTGMTHRDLKPENIMIERLPAGDDFVHVLDFGIVHMEGEVNLTQGFIGTPLYASPEQAMGEDVDSRSDIYSLGAIAFFMLTSRPPFVGQNVMQVLRQHVETKAPRVSAVRKAADVPAQLDELVARMLAKNPDARPQTLEEVIRMLDVLSRRDVEHSDKVKVAQEHYTSVGGAETAPEADFQAHQAGSSTSHGLPHPEKVPPSALTSSAPGTQDTIPVGPSTLNDVSSEPEVSVRPDAESEREVVRESVPDSVVDRSQLQSDSYTRVAPSSGIFGKIRRPRSNPRIMPPEPRHIKDVIDTAEVEYGQLSLTQFGQPALYSLGPEHCMLSISDELHLWRLQPHRHKSFVISSGVDDITALAMSRKYALIGRVSGVIEMLDLKTGELTELFRSVFSDPVQDLAVSHDGQVMLAVMDSGRVYMSASHKDSHDWVRVRGGCKATAIRLDQRSDLFAVARTDGTVEIARLSAPKQIRVTLETQLNVSHIAFSEDGYLVGLMEPGGEHVSLYQVISGKHMVDVGTEGNTLLAMDFSSDNELIGYLKNRDYIFVRSLQSLS